MLTKNEAAELLLRLNAYVVAVTNDTDSRRREGAVDRQTRALERLLEFIEEIS